MPRPAPPLTSILGPHPGAPAHPLAHHVTTAVPFSTSSMTPLSDQSILIQALNSMLLQSSAPGTDQWFMDTGASSHHMSSGGGNFSSLSSSPAHPHIIVGNCASLPVTHAAATSIPTPSRPLHLSNVLIAPHIIKNLLSVRALTRDNSVSVEFDPTGFSVKDLRTKAVMLRCDRTGHLYPLPACPASTTNALLAISSTT